MRMTEKELKQICATGHCRIRSQTLIKPTEKKNTADKRMDKDNCLAFDSEGERQYYNLYIFPRIHSGEITSCELHREFTILDAIPEYGLRAKVFTPDFILHMKDKTVRVVEMKGSVVKRLQRDYQLRKHLFISRYCIPNGWSFFEEKSEDWSN